MRKAIFPAAFLALLTACAARIPYATPDDPLRCLAPDAVLYARLSAPSIRDFAGVLLAPEEARSLAALLERSSALALGLLAAAPAEAKGRPGQAAGRPPFEAAFLGNYPFRSASVALAGRREWKRDGRGLVNEAAGLRVAFPGPTMVLVTSGPIEPLIDRLIAPGPSPIPAEFAPLAEEDLVLYAPRPFQTLAAAAFGESLGVPALGLIVAARRIAADPAPADYELSVAFLMPDANAARVYRGAARLAWYALSRALFTESAKSLSGAELKQEGRFIAATGLRTSAAELSAAFSALTGYAGGSRAR